MKILTMILVLVAFKNIFANDNLCINSKITIQVLGSGGPELTPGRASSSYLVWHNNKAVILIDAGGGSALRFGESKAQWIDLKAVLFTHFHADHSSDFPAMIKASWFGDRIENLPIFGPYANNYMPSTLEFLDALFGSKKGAFKYMSDMYNDQGSGYKLIPHTIDNIDSTQEIYNQYGLIIFAHQVKHGPIPAFAYVIEICGKTMVFSGDTNGEGFKNLQIENTNIFIAHNAIPQNAGTIAQSLHMTPEKIGQIAKHLNVRQLILSHRMNRSLGREHETEIQIKKAYSGQIIYANDLDVFDAMPIVNNQ